jgi:hypothetical protein
MAIMDDLLNISLHAPRPTRGVIISSDHLVNSQASSSQRGVFSAKAEARERCAKAQAATRWNVLATTDVQLTSSLLVRNVCSRAFDSLRSEAIVSCSNQSPAFAKSLTSDGAWSRHRISGQLRGELRSFTNSFQKLGNEPIHVRLCGFEGGKRCGHHSDPSRRSTPAELQASAPAGCGRMPVNLAHPTVATARLREVYGQKRRAVGEPHPAQEWHHPLHVSLL